MRNTIYILILVVITSCTNDKPFIQKIENDGSYAYEIVTNDPSNSRIYTLKNGLKVYLSRNPQQPKIYSRIAVKAGGKNGPKNHTGLAHYLEHIMFKGSDKIGTVDWDSEKVLLDSIENMFEVYASITDSTERLTHFKNIDQVSNEAANYAIPGELEKMFSLIGADRSNAGTGEDKTVFRVQIPSNELERYLKIEGNRFSKMVPRLFHTELEAVYEEKNMDDDWMKTMELFMASMFKIHPYGTQSTIGTVEHLKNPSIKAIKEYFDDYYVANNMAVILSGDLEFSEAITLVDKYFGTIPSGKVPPLQLEEEKFILKPVEVEYIGPDPEFFVMGFRFPFQRNSKEYYTMKLTDMLLKNGVAGLIDVNLDQKVAYATSYPYLLKDYSVHAFEGEAKSGQTLMQVKELILAEIEKLKAGEFDENLIKSVIMDFKKHQMEVLRNNADRTDWMVEAFAYDVSWHQHVSEFNIMSEISKQQIMDFVKTYYQQNYVVVYKREGEIVDQTYIPKPPITQISMNRESKSNFYRELEMLNTEELQPVFMDFDKEVNDIQINEKVSLITAHHELDSLFNIEFVYDSDKINDPLIKLAIEYLSFVGTDKKNVNELKIKFYELGSSSITSGEHKDGYFHFGISGLTSNFESSMNLLKEILTHPVSDNETFEAFIDNWKKEQVDNKKNKYLVLRKALFNYVKYGEKSPFRYHINNIDELSISDILIVINDLLKVEHRVLYHGMNKSDDINEILQSFYNKGVPSKTYRNVIFNETTFKETKKIILADFESPQFEAILVKQFDSNGKDIRPETALYTEYLNQLAYQEIRESRGLAYSVKAKLLNTTKQNNYGYFMFYFATQVDKVYETLEVTDELLQNLPKSELTFSLAKEALLQQLASERILNTDKAWFYISAKDNGEKHDYRAKSYTTMKNMTLDDLIKFHNNNIKTQPVTVIMVGPQSKINEEGFQTIDYIEMLSVEDIF